MAKNKGTAKPPKTTIPNASAPESAVVPETGAQESGTVETDTNPNTGATSVGTQEPGAGTVDANPNPDANATGATENPNPVPNVSDKKNDPKETVEPKVSDAVVKIGKTLLKSNPAMSVVFMTSDGRGFYEKNDADNHARTLKNKVVTPVKK